MQSVAVDSGPLVALFNRGDPWTPVILAWLESNPKCRLFTTWPVLTEVCALLTRRMSSSAALDFLRWIERGGVEVDVPVSASFHHVLAITDRYQDIPFDLADASVAELAARRSIRDILTIDADFDIYRDARGKPLRNVLRKSM